MLVGFVLFLSCGLAVRGSSSCTSIDDSPGLCVLFTQCPRLLKFLQSSSISSESLHLLQTLTCEIRNNQEPKICCPLSSVVKPTTGETKDSVIYPSEENKKPNVTDYTIEVSSQSQDGSKLIVPVSSTPPPPQISRLPTIIKNPELTMGNTYNDLRDHPNFHLIPNLIDCSRITTNSDRIVGGKQVNHGALPWMARIGYRRIDSNIDDSPEFYCAGTVINSKYILTAAHCTEEIDSDYTPSIIRLAEHNASTENDCSSLGCSKAVDYPIERILPHEEYNTDTKANDIGLIRVDREIVFDTPYVKPVCLPFVDEYQIGKFFPKNITNRKGTVAGWGKTKWNRAEGSQNLLEVIIPFVSNEECERKYGNRIPVTHNHLCAGGIRGKDSCGGDSGGPIMANSRTSQKSSIKFFQLGIVSFGPVRCGFGELPGVYSRLTSYLKWILDTIEP